MFASLLAGTILTMLPIHAAAAQDALTHSPVAAAVPFGVGELAEYDARFMGLKLGSGAMQVMGIDTVRGREAWRTQLRINGGTFFYKIDDVLESWMSVDSLHSLRFRQDIDEGAKERTRLFEILPERMIYTLNGGPETESVSNPLDDGSFLYFIRTVPLEVGQTYTFQRYFRPDRNPVIIKVLRKEEVTVPAGKFPAIVVQPSIKTTGIFSEGGQAEIWFSDDALRIMLQMRSKMSFGSLSLHLRSYTPPTKMGR